MLNNMSCPMTKDVPLTDDEIAKFCNLGCSVDCDKFLAEYIEKRDAKKMQVVNVNAQVIPECCYQCSNLHVDPFKPSICSLGMALPIKKQSCKRMNMQIREAVQLPIPKGKCFEKAIISLLCQSNQWYFGIDLMTKTSGHYFGPNPSLDKPYESRDQAIEAGIKYIVKEWPDYRSYLIRSDYGSYLYGAQMSLF
ncbi:MAG: hypothetical protein AB9883_07635 [Acidaminococcaceae bacterium]